MITKWNRMKLEAKSVKHKQFDCVCRPITAQRSVYGCSIKMR